MNRGMTASSFVVITLVRTPASNSRTFCVTHRTGSGFEGLHPDGGIMLTWSHLPEMCPISAGNSKLITPTIDVHELTAMPVER